MSYVLYGNLFNYFVLLSPIQYVVCRKTDLRNCLQILQNISYLWPSLVEVVVAVGYSSSFLITNTSAITLPLLIQFISWWYQDLSIKLYITRI